MTEFWVSKAKHFCNLCKVWCQGDPVSIKRHEEGVGHKNKVAHRLKAKRSAPRLDGDLAQQLAEIEAGAAKAMRATAAGGKFAGVIDSDPTWGVRFRPGGGPRDGEGWYEGDATADFYKKFNANSFSNEKPPAVAREEEDAGGEYVARGVKYFQGRAHAEKFRTGVAVEVWIEAAEAWVPGEVVRVKRFASVDGEQRFYDVKVEEAEVPTEASRLERHFAKQRDGIIRDVEAADLRVAAGADGVWHPPRRTHREVPSAPVDENTGMGRWTTVSVREVDEAEEERKRDQAEKKRDDERARREARIKARERQAEEQARYLCEIEENRDALNSHLGLFDRTDVYRGIQLADDAAAVPPVVQVGDDAAPDAPAPVFKKRKATAAFRKKTTR